MIVSHKANTLWLKHRSQSKGIFKNNMHFPESPRFNQVLCDAWRNTSRNPLLKQYMEKIIDRVSTVPQTFIHGDMFPTNVLVHNEKIRFVDFADVGLAPYMMDMGRLTGLIDKDTLQTMCPCPEKAIDAYYREIRLKVPLDYEDYLSDIRMAQFLELAYIYCPPGSGLYLRDFKIKVATLPLGVYCCVKGYRTGRCFQVHGWRNFKMLAYTYIEHGKFKLLKKPKPVLIDDRDAIVKVTLGSICTSDLHIKHGSVPRAVPGITVGHEMVGVVEEVGSAVNTVQPGDRVTVNVETFCGECFFCRHGFVNNCTHPNGG